MRDPLNRLYRTKIAFLSVVLVFTGLALISFDHWLTASPRWRWISDWPFNDVGIGLFTTGLLGVALQYFIDEDKELHDTERLRRVLAETAPAMRDAVISGFAFQPDDLARVATPEVLDQIITNGLAIRLGDATFAQEIYADLHQQAVDVPERLHDARVSIRLSPLSADSGTPKRRAALLDVVVRWEFTVTPVYTTRRFVCTSDAAEFRDVDQESAATSAWFFKPKAGLEADNPSAFEVIECTVDGEPRKIRRTVKAGSQTYAVSVGSDAVAAGRPVQMAYAYRTVTAKAGQLLRFRIDQPTRGLTVELDYRDTKLASVRAIDYLAASAGSRVSDGSPARSIQIATVSATGWVMPGSGVAFVWQTSKEEDRERSDPSAAA